MKTKKRQNVDVTELSPNKRFPKNFLIKNVSAGIAVENTKTDLYMLRDVRQRVEAKHLDSNMLTLKCPFPYRYVAETSNSQGTGALNYH